MFRGAEYQRFFIATQKEPLTFHDMNLMSQDQQTFFVCEIDKGKPECERKAAVGPCPSVCVCVSYLCAVFGCLVMLKAWRERKSELRIQYAKQALQEKSDYVPALLLVAEEECTMHIDVSNVVTAFDIAYRTL